MPDNKPPRKPAAPQFDAGHVPITEEFDSPKRTLPPAVPLAIALVAVIIVVGVVAFLFRAKPVAQGGIDAVYFSEPANMTNAMVLLQVTLRNVGSKTLYIKAIKADLKTDQELSDDAASPSDYDRYFMAYPDLKRAQHAAAGCGDEDRAWRRTEGHGAGFVSRDQGSVRRAQGFGCDHRALRPESDCAAPERCDEIIGALRPWTISVKVQRSTTIFLCSPY